MSKAMIEVSGLRKRFGPVLALDGISFAVQPGQVTGFVGPNGAGKSTTMRVILGLDAVQAGTALVGGVPYRSLRHPLTAVGSLLDAAALQPSRTARNHLLWLARSQGLPVSRVDEVIDQAGLTAAARRKAGGFSLGMRHFRACVHRAVDAQYRQRPVSQSALFRGGTVGLLPADPVRDHCPPDLGWKRLLHFSQGAFRNG